MTKSSFLKRLEKESIEMVPMYTVFYLFGFDNLVQISILGAFELRRYLPISFNR